MIIATEDTESAELIYTCCSSGTEFNSVPFFSVALCFFLCGNDKYRIDPGGAEPEYIILAAYALQSDQPILTTGVSLYE